MTSAVESGEGNSHSVRPERPLLVAFPAELAADPSGVPGGGRRHLHVARYITAAALSTPAPFEVCSRRTFPSRRLSRGSVFESARRWFVRKVEQQER
jgi:hypothetical protein